MNGRGPAKKRPASRSAGVHMLRGARAAALPNLAADIGSHAASDDGSDVDDDDEVNANSEGDEGVISSRLRLRKGAPPLVDDDASMANASASDCDLQDLPDLNEQDTTGSERDEPEQPVNSARARARRAAAAIAAGSDSDDPLQDTPAAFVQPAARAAQAVNTDLHVLELSVTLSKSKGHVNPAWLQLIKNWMEERTVAGAAALERGGISTSVKRFSDPADFFEALNLFIIAPPARRPPLSHARSTSKLFVRLLVSCCIELPRRRRSEMDTLISSRRCCHHCHHCRPHCRPPPAAATLFLAAAASTPQPTTPKTEPLLPSPSPPPPPRSPSPLVRAHVPRCEGRAARRALEMKRCWRRTKHVCFAESKGGSSEAEGEGRPRPPTPPPFSFSPPPPAGPAPPTATEGHTSILPAPPPAARSTDPPYTHLFRGVL